MEVFQFADDSVESLQHIIVGERAALGDWFGVSGITLNVEKTQVIHFRTDNKHSSQK